MKRYDRITPEGTRDYVLKECRLLRKADNILRDLYQKYGYSEVITPSIEFYDVFSDGVGRVSQNELYTLTDSNGRLLTMRPDSTKPIARLYAAHLQKLELPLKLFYSQPVFKRNINFYKKSDEIMQTGVELLGLNNFKSDIEIIMLSIKSMQLLFGDDFIIEIGHMGFIKALLDELDISAKLELRHAIATKNYPDLNRLAALLGEKGEILKSLPELFGDSTVLERAETLFSDSRSQEALKQLKEVLAVLEQNGLKDNVLVDLAVINDYEYYTGIVFKGFVKNESREILSGGRYDTLYNDYGLNVPAVGFAVNTDEAARLLVKKQRSKERETERVAIYTDDPDLFKLQQLIDSYSAKGVTSAISLFDNIEDTLRWAQKIGAKKLVKIKDSVVSEVKL
ncbi:MAG: ATP phosphoribosyltransferase regulatory subunit [Clostridia bacterium]|nr:ATP phosphoribosyltransferase regulatory subunit [Clostridia bacterium]